MSEKSREHIHPVMLNATFYVGITKLEARLECSKSAAILYALNEGLFKEGVISQEDHDLLAQRYGRKLKDVIVENQLSKENSHLSKLDIEKRKRELIQASAQKAKTDEILAGSNSALKGMFEQWEDHKELNWRLKAVAYAKKFPENEFAKLLIEKEQGDIISQKSKESAI